MPYLLDKLKKIPDGDGNVLDNSLVIYGSAMGNSNLHNHKRCPLFFAGHAGGRAPPADELRKKDVRFTTEPEPGPARPGAPVLLSFTEDPWGVKIELLQRPVSST